MSLVDHCGAALRREGAVYLFVTAPGKSKRTRVRTIFLPPGFYVIEKRACQYSAFSHREWTADGWLLANRRGDRAVEGARLEIV